MDEQQKPEPDYGSTLVWSNDDERNVNMLLANFEGNIKEAVRRLFVSGGGTSYQYARVLSVRFASRFGISEVDFMKLYRHWRQGKL